MMSYKKKLHFFLNFCSYTWNNKANFLTLYILTIVDMGEKSRLNSFRLKVGSLQVDKLWESGQTPGDSEEQGGLACPWFMGSQRVRHDWLNWTELNWYIYIFFFLVFYAVLYICGLYWSKYLGAKGKRCLTIYLKVMMKSYQEPKVSTWKHIYRNICSN